MNVLRGLPRSDLGQKGFKSHLYDFNRIITGELDTFTFMGDVVILCGWEGSGKSFICMNLARAAQEQGLGVVVIDTEGPWRKERVLQSVGIDLAEDRFVPLISSDLEDIVKLLERIRQNLEKYKDEKVLIILDSISGIFQDRDQKAWEKGEIKLDQGLESRIIRKLMNALKSYAKKFEIPIVITTHVYKNPQQMYSSDNISGGGGVRFYSDTIVQLRAVKDKRGQNKEVVGVIVEGVTLKNRNVPPFQKAFLGIDFGTGRIDPYIGLVDIALEAGLMEQSGAWLEDYRGRKVLKRDASKLFDSEFLEKLKPYAQTFKRLHYEGSRFLGVDSMEDLANVNVLGSEKSDPYLEEEPGDVPGTESEGVVDESPVDG